MEDNYAQPRAILMQTFSSLTDAAVDPSIVDAFVQKGDFSLVDVLRLSPARLLVEAKAILQDKGIPLKPNSEAHKPFVQSNGVLNPTEKLHQFYQAQRGKPETPEVAELERILAVQKVRSLTSAEKVTLHRLSYLPKTETPVQVDQSSLQTIADPAKRLEFFQNAIRKQRLTERLADQERQLARLVREKEVKVAMHVKDMIEATRRELEKLS